LLDVIGQRGIEVLGHADLALPLAAGARSLILAEANQPRDGLARLGDDELLALGCSFEQLGEVGLGLVDVECFHASSLTNLVYLVKHDATGAVLHDQNRRLAWLWARYRCACWTWGRERRFVFWA